MTNADGQTSTLSTHFIHAVQMKHTSVQIKSNIQQRTGDVIPFPDP
jgi:hypothetical protein